LYCYNTSIAQSYLPVYSPVTNVKTPNNSTVQDVHTLIGSDISLTPNQLSALITEITVNYSAQYMEIPSCQYNCHAYTWHVSEGGSKVWIGLDPFDFTAEDIYWTDGSYVEVSESSATKVSYHQSGNHSAIRLSSTWYQSKWGQSALVMHAPNNVPPAYQASLEKRYYIKKSSILISGYDAICTSSTFTVSPTPVSYTWNKSSNLTLVSTSGNTATFTSNGTSGIGWISIVVNGIEVAKRNVQVGIPVITITGPTSTPNGQYAHYYATTPSGTSPTSYQWSLSPQNNNVLYGATSYSLDIAFYTAGNYQLVCRATNSCGQGGYTALNGINVYNTSSYSIAYPNPALSTLTVSFNPELVAQTKASLQSAIGTLGAVKTKGFALDVKLYDSFGTLQRQTTSAGDDVTLDVSGLRNGIYVLHVHDGIAAKPEVHKMIVSH
jgi:hypothetical protein